MIGPVDSIATTGIARKVTIRHAAPNRLAMIAPRNPARSSIAWMIIDTVVFRIAHPAIAGKRCVAAASEPRD